MHGYTKEVQRQVHFVAVELAFCQLLERSMHGSCRLLVFSLLLTIGMILNGKWLDPAELMS